MRKTQMGLVLALSALCGLPAGAHEAPAHAAKTGAPADDAKAITHAMKAQFDKPTAPLTVKPVLVEGDFAVAGWLQEGRGGRALLSRHKGTWRIDLCGGDGLVQADALVQAGLAKPAAARLAKSIQTAEARLTAAERKQLSSFDGIIKVGAGHDAHHAPAHGAKH